MTENDDDRLVRTRRAWHGAAEMLLAAPQYDTSGTIRLRVVPSGFGTVATPELRVERAEIVVGTRRLQLTGHTYAAVAQAAGLTARRLDDLYSDGTRLRPEDVVDVDPACAAQLADAFAAGESALRSFAPDETPVLWPEHFDVGIRTGGVNYGLSPGDDFHATPYAYIGSTPSPAGDFWNAPFGAFRPLAELGSADGVLAFYREGRLLIEESASAPGCPGRQNPATDAT